jgi:integrase
MGSVVLLDAAGRRRSVATLPGHHCGRAPRNKGMRYPADPPTVEEIVAVMRHAGDRPHGIRLRGLIVVMWRAGLRISEALALTESDLDEARGAILVRHGKNDKRREVGMDQWGWEQLRPWLSRRPHPRPPTDTNQRASAAAPHRSQGRRATSLCAASATPRARSRDGQRGRTAQRHPTPTRPRQPRDHIRVPGGHRQHRDHRHRPRPPSPDDPRQRRPAPVGARARRRWWPGW